MLAPNTRRRQRRLLTRGWALWLTLLWALVLLGPLGPGGRLAHHHEAGHSGHDCLACALLYSPLAPPDAVVPVARLMPITSAAAHPTVVRPTSSVHSPAIPRAPPVVASETA